MDAVRLAGGLLMLMLAMDLNPRPKVDPKAEERQRLQEEDLEILSSVMH